MFQGRTTHRALEQSTHRSIERISSAQIQVAILLYSFFLNNGLITSRIHSQVMIFIFVSFLCWASAPTLVCAWNIPCPCQDFSDPSSLNLPILDGMLSPYCAGPSQNPRPQENPTCSIFVSPTVPRAGFFSELKLEILNGKVLLPYHTGEKLKLIQPVPFPLPALCCWSMAPQDVARSIHSRLLLHKTQVHMHYHVFQGQQCLVFLGVHCVLLSIWNTPLDIRTEIFYLESSSGNS